MRAAGLGVARWSEADDGHDDSGGRSDDTTQGTKTHVERPFVSGTYARPSREVVALGCSQMPFARNVRIDPASDHAPDCEEEYKWRSYFRSHLDEVSRAPLPLTR